MKNIYFLYMFALFSFHGNSQETEKVFGIERTVTKTIDIDLNEVYNKNTGEKMDPEKVVQLIRNNSNIQLEPFFGEDGKVSRFYYFPEASSVIGTVTTDRIEAGKPFPEFKMKTTEGKIVRLKDLKGKVVILHFGLDTMRFRYDELENLNTKIDALDKKEDVEALVVMEGSATSLGPKFNLEISNFALVNEASGFIRKCGLRRFPSTIVLDAEGKLIGIFKEVEEIHLASYF